jgi:hypothetical protein
MESYGFLWIPKDSYGFLRIPKDSYGFLLGPSSQLRTPVLRAGVTFGVIAQFGWRHKVIPSLCKP